MNSLERRSIFAVLAFAIFLALGIEAVLLASAVMGGGQ